MKKISLIQYKIKSKVKKILNRLTLLRIKKYSEINGWLTEQEAILLYSTASKLKKRATVVEIGSWQGKSTYCIAKGLSSGTLFAIDPFNADAGSDISSEKEYLQKSENQDLLEKFKLNLKYFLKRNSIKILKGYSYQFHQQFEQIDFLFIDGDHSIKGCSEDYEFYSAKIVKGGFIAFHDYDETRDELGPTHVIQNIILKDNKFKFYRRADSLWIAKRN